MRQHRLTTKNGRYYKVGTSTGATRKRAAKRKLSNYTAAPPHSKGDRKTYLHYHLENRVPGKGGITHFLNFHRKRTLF